MPLGDISGCIEEYKKYNIYFTSRTSKKILKDCDSWKSDWAVVFRKLLQKIKKTAAPPHANDDRKGYRVTHPIVMNRYMALFYETHNDGSYTVYDFELGFNKI